MHLTWSQQFYIPYANIGRSPQPTRCTDCCWSLFLIPVTLCFFIFLGYHQTPIPEKLSTPYGFNTPFGVQERQQSQLQAQLRLKTKNIDNLSALLSLLSLSIAIIYLKMTRQATQLMLFISVLCVSCLLFGLSLVLLTIGYVFPAVFAMLLFVLYGLGILFYFRYHYQSAILFIKIALHFLSQTWCRMCGPILLSLLGVFLAVASAYSLGQNYIMGGGDSRKLGQALFFTIFFTLFLYYMMTLFIGTYVADWFYGRPAVCCAGFNKICRHVGSITLLSLLMPIVKVLQLLIRLLLGDPDSNRNKCCVSYMGWWLFDLQKVHTFNSYAVMLMGQTGMDLMDAANMASVVYVSNFGLFTTLEGISTFMFMSGVAISSITPTIVGFLILKFKHMELLLDIGAMSILLVCAVMSVLVMAIFSQTLVGLFLFYCLEKHLHDQGAHREHYYLNNPVDLLSRQYLIAGDLTGYTPSLILRAAVEQSRVVNRQGQANVGGPTNINSPVNEASPAREDGPTLQSGMIYIGEPRSRMA